MLVAGPYMLQDVGNCEFKLVADRELVREGLRKAGVPDAGAESEECPGEVAGATTIYSAQAKALHDRGVAFADVRPVRPNYLREPTFAIERSLIAAFPARARHLCLTGLMVLSGVGRGTRLGRMLFGSTAVLEMDERFEYLANKGERVVAGETILIDEGQLK